MDFGLLPPVFWPPFVKPFQPFLNSFFGFVDWPKQHWIWRPFVSCLILRLVLQGRPIFSRIRPRPRFGRWPRPCPFPWPVGLWSWRSWLDAFGTFPFERQFCLKMKFLVSKQDWKFQFLMTEKTKMTKKGEKIMTITKITKTTRMMLMVICSMVSEPKLWEIILEKYIKNSKKK